MTQMHPMPGARLSGADELNVALATTASFARAHQHADQKVSALIVVYAGLIAALATQAIPIRDLYVRGGAESWILLVLLGAFGGGFLAGGYQLVQALRPRTRPPRGTNRFAFRVAAAATRSASPSSAGASQQCEEAWKLAAHMSALAVVKFRRTSRAIAWTAFVVIDFVVLAAFVAVSGLP